MMNVVTKRVNEAVWMTDEAKKIVKDFNEAEGNLILSFYDEHETVEDYESALEEGMYDFIYPEANPHSEELKEMIEEASKYPRFIGFDYDDLML